MLQALHAQPGLFGSRLVIKPGMKNAAVVSGLMGGQLRLLFQENEPKSRPCLQQSKRRGQPDDASTDDNDILSHKFEVISRGVPGEGINGGIRVRRHGTPSESWGQTRIF